MNFSSVEIRILRIWADAVMHGGHWGDGAVVLPDEAAALERIGQAENGCPVELSARHLFTFLVWSGESTGTPEEDALCGRLERTLVALGGKPPLH